MRRTATRQAWAGADDIGQRKSQQDRWRVREGVTLDPGGDHPVAVVCDGLGGHTNGEKAAAAAIDAFMDSYTHPTGSTGARQDNAGRREPVPRRLVAAVEAAERQLTVEIRRNPALHGMGTTLTACAVCASGIDYVNVGDSPLYRVNVKTGYVKLVSRLHHLESKPNILTSALMGQGINELSGGTGSPLEPCERMVIASDGLDTLPNDEIAAVLAQIKDDDNGARALVDRTLAHALEIGVRRQDNTTVVVLHPAGLPGLEPASEPAPIKAAS